MKLVADDFLWSLNFSYQEGQVWADLSLQIGQGQELVQRRLPLLSLAHMEAWIQGMTALLEGTELFYESDFDQAYLSVTIDPSDQDWHMQVTLTSLPIEQEPQAVMGINLALLEQEEEEAPNPPGETIEIDLELSTQELSDFKQQIVRDYLALGQGGDR